MARGQRLSTEEKIQRLRDKITDVSDKKQTAIKKYDEEIKQIKDEIAALLEEQRVAVREELFEKFESSGLSVDDFIKSVKKNDGAAE